MISIHDEPSLIYSPIGLPTAGFVSAACDGVIQPNISANKMMSLFFIVIPRVWETLVLEHVVCALSTVDHGFCSRQPCPGTCSMGFLWKRKSFRAKRNPRNKFQGLVVKSRYPRCRNIFPQGIRDTRCGIVEVGFFDENC